jgi:predicted Zn finger-like uncharacterized protein
MRVHCPACLTEYQVPEAVAAAASRARCVKCGGLFTLSAVAPDADGAPLPAPSISSPPGPDAPHPPHVVEPPSRVTSSVEAISEQDARVRPSQPETASEPPLGRPPPYRPGETAPRSAQSRVEMAPPPFDLPRISAFNTLGPVQPYRPTVPGGDSVARGGPSDQEPSRYELAARSIALTPGLPAGSDWSLLRETAQNTTADGRRTSRRTIDARVEESEDTEEQGVPGLTTAGEKKPWALSWLMSRGGLAAAYGRIRSVHWAAVIVLIVGVLIGALHSEKDTVMRAFPGAVRVYAALGVGPSAASSVSYQADAGGAPGKCAEGTKVAAAGPPDGGDIACGTTQSEAKLK